MKKIILAAALIVTSCNFVTAQNNSKQVAQEVVTPEMNAEKEATYVWKELTLNDTQRFKYKQATVKRKYDVKALKEKPNTPESLSKDTKVINEAFFNTVTPLFTPDQLAKWPAVKKELESTYLILN